jgi:hypothetical protein
MMDTTFRKLDLCLPSGVRKCKDPIKKCSLESVYALQKEPRPFIIYKKPELINYTFFRNIQNYCIIFRPSQ